jgi:hypothetical protein
MAGVWRRSWLGWAFAALLCVALAACTTTDSKRAEFAKPQTIAPGAKVLVIKPDVELVMLLASGLEEPKADWSKSGAENLVVGIEAQLRQRGHARAGDVVDPATMTEGRVGQVLRLHDAVAQSILVFHHGGGRILPTKRNSFDWTIGEGRANSPPQPARTMRCSRWRAAPTPPAGAPRWRWWACLACSPATA